MKMISTARLRGAQQRVEEVRPFSQNTTKTLNNIKNLATESANSKNMLILLSTDRGLCGAINSQVVRTARVLLNDSSKGKTLITVLGEKAVPQITRTNAESLTFSVTDLAKKGSNFVCASVIVERILDSPQAADVDNFYVLFNKFKTVMSSFPTLVVVPSARAMRKKVEEGLPELDLYEFEDDFKFEHLADLAQYHLAVTVYSSLLENQTSELGARMTSMDNATKNASEMIKKLTIKYNRGRQAAITTELSEIIGGAESLKSEDKVEVDINKYAQNIQKGTSEKVQKILDSTKKKMFQHQ